VGRRKLAYEIRKKKEGIYCLIRFKGEPSILPIIGRRYQLHENLLRHIIVLYEAPPIDTGAGQNPGFNPSHAIIEN
jgi:ribosomal protein S6